MRIWFKIYKDNHLQKDLVVEDTSELNRTRKVTTALETACHTFDLAVPMWLNSTITDFKIHAKARFNKDNFLEEIDFDFLEIHVIEE